MESEKTAVGVDIERPSRQTDEPSEIGPAERANYYKRHRRVSRLALSTAIGSIAALLIILAYVYTHPRQLPQVVGTLTSVIDAEWSDPTLPVTGGSEVRVGNMELVAGYARITFDSSAEIIVQAPAEFEAVSMDRVFLHRGRLTAEVPKEAFGFTVSTPNAKIVDLGTEFGVLVRTSGFSDVHVFKGEVALSADRQESDTDQRTRHLITEGHAKRVETDRSVKDVSFDETAFVRQAEFDISLKASQGSLYHRWLAHSNKLRRDPYLVVYYTFDNALQNPDHLLNMAQSTEGVLNVPLRQDSDVRGIPEWTVGRWPQKGALDFNRAEFDYIELPYDPQLDIEGAITIRVMRSPAHPGGVHIYRIEGRDWSLVYATDTEGYANVDRRLADFARNADLLIHDAQYTEDHYLGKSPGSQATQGWGHSTAAMACEVARIADAKYLALFHYDPGYSDQDIDRIVMRARQQFPDVFAPHEGLEISLGGEMDKGCAAFVPQRGAAVAES